MGWLCFHPQGWGKPHHVQARYCAGCFCGFFCFPPFCANALLCTLQPCRVPASTSHASMPATASWIRRCSLLLLLSVLCLPDNLPLHNARCCRCLCLPCLALSPMPPSPPPSTHSRPSVFLSPLCRSFQPTAWAERDWQEWQQNQLPSRFKDLHWRFVAIACLFLAGGVQGLKAMEGVEGRGG